MIWLIYAALILGTWALAAALVPVAARARGEWPLPALLCLGCSGPIAAILLAASQ